MVELILYACPLGELADQLETYFQESLRLCGWNAAHGYMPHCTLTGFFRDEEAAIPLYLRAMDQALQEASPAPSPVLTIPGMAFHPDWHGLELQSDWLINLTRNFIGLAQSPTRQEALRLKDWLHLSLAYSFPPHLSHPLTRLAEKYVNPTTPVIWELRFYQRHPDHTWTCHQSWPL